MPHTQTALPPELIDKIITNLHPREDQTTLLACSQVAHSWLPGARYRLLSQTTINVFRARRHPLEEFSTFMQSSVELAKTSALSIPFAYAFIRSIYVTETLPAYCSISCTPTVSLESIDLLLSATPYLQSLSLVNIRLSGENVCASHRNPRHLAKTQVHVLSALTLVLDSLEVDVSLPSLLGLFSQIGKLSISCRVGRRIIDCLYMHSPSSTSFHLRDNNESLPPLDITQLYLDCDVHLSHLATYLCERREVRGLTTLEARCYCDQGVSKLKPLIAKLPCSNSSHLNLDAVHPNQTLPDTLLADISGLQLLSLSGLIYLPRYSPEVDFPEPQTRYWPPFWTLLSHHNSTLQHLTLELRIRGDDAHAKYVLQDRLDLRRLEDLLSGWEGLEGVTLVFDTPHTIQAATIRYLETFVGDYIPRLSRKVALQTVVRPIL